MCDPSHCSLLRERLILFVTAGLLVHGAASGQSLTGALIGTVKDEQGGVLGGARVTITSPALIGGPETQLTSDTGQLRFPSLPPGPYLLRIELQGFTPYREEDIRVGAGATIERTAILKVRGVAESVVVEGVGSRVEARDPGFGTRFTLEEIRTTPTRRTSMFDFIRAAPGISPTSPSSGSITTVSAFGSGINENQFLIDGTNFTCPCNGIARAEPAFEFIQEVQVQSVGASAEYGNVQGAVINVVMRQGGDRFSFDGSFYGQTDALTAQPRLQATAGSGSTPSGYERVRYRDVTLSSGGPAHRDRLWFFGGYQHLRDDDSQPGADARFPRKYAQDKGYGKLTWRLAPRWQLVQSIHNEQWVNADPSTAVTPFEVTLRRSTSVPAITFGQLTYTSPATSVWDLRVGRFVFDQDIAPSTGDRTRTSQTDNVTGVSSGGPPMFTDLRIARTTAKATFTHYPGVVLGADHQWKAGVQVERGGHDAANIIPTGVRYVDSNGRPSQSISSDPSHVGATFVTVAAFASDTLTLGNRTTINLGLRFDHTRAFSQDLSRVDLEGRDTGQIVSGAGALYTWNLWSPRLGLAAKLTGDGRTMLRASYGRFSHGVLTGELEIFHPGQSPVTIKAFDSATGGYTRVLSVLSNKQNVLLDRDMRAPRSDAYSVGVDREVGRKVAVALAYIRKHGADFIGWREAGGQYRAGTRALPDGTRVPVLELTSGPDSRRFLLTNPDGYSITYNGLVVAVEKRRSRRWHARSSYTLSKAYGLQASSGTSAAGPQLSTVSPGADLRAPQPLTFGRDPNDLANARGRLPNDRPHIFRATGGVDLPRTGIDIAANFQYFSGKPWAATALVMLPQNPQQRVLLEPRGSRRLSAQSLLDLRVSRSFQVGGLGRFDLMLDLLNALNDTAEEGLATDDRFSANFARPTLFVDPRRVMLGARVSLGR